MGARRVFTVDDGFDINMGLTAVAFLVVKPKTYIFMANLAGIKIFTRAKRKTEI